MSNNTNPQPDNQEVDLGQLFNSIGKLFEKLFGLIKSVFQFLFNTIVAGSKALIDNYKILAVILVVSGILGYVLEKRKAVRYESSMLVRTYFDSKYQLNNNLGFYNNLINDNRHDELAKIFEINEDIAKLIVEFELQKGPENENTKMKAYDAFVRTLDTIRAQEITFEEFLDNRDLLTGDLFYIRVETLDKDIFNDLNTGINKSFENLYSTKKLQKRDSMLQIRKQTILQSIAEIDSLQNVYINVLEQESQATKTRISLGEGFPLQQEKSSTNEYQLLNKEIQLRDELRELEETGLEENEFFDVISAFQQSGSAVSNIWSNYTIMLPIVALLGTILFYLLSKYIRFVKNYEL